MAVLPLLLTRPQALKIADGDPQAMRQVEQLIALANFTGFGQCLTADDVDLDATGVTFAVTLPLGQHLIDLIVMVNTTGGSPTDGFTLSNVTAAPLAAGFICLTQYDGTTMFMATISNAAATMTFSGATETQVQVRGFIEVQTAGVVGFSITREGAPSSATLLAGSGLTCTIQRGT